MIVLREKKREKKLESSHQMLQMHINFSGTSAALAGCFVAERSSQAKLVSWCIMTPTARINPTLQTFQPSVFYMKIGKNK